MESRDNHFIFTEKFAINVKDLIMVYLGDEGTGSHLLGLSYTRAGDTVNVEVKCENYLKAKALYDKVLDQIAEYTNQVYDRGVNGREQENA